MAITISNKIQNPGFETGTFADWTVSNASIDAAHSHSGSFSARLTGGAVNAFVSQFFSVNPEENFQANVALAKLSPATSPPIGISVSYYTAALSFLGVGLNIFIPAGRLPDNAENDWTQITAIASPAPAGAAVGQMTVFKSALAGSADVLIDDVALLLFEGSSTPSPSPDPCFQDMRTTLQQLQGKLISVTLSGCCDDSLFGRVFRVDDGKMILVGTLGTRIIPICTISSIDFGPFAYVAVSADDTVAVINTANNTVIALIPVGNNPAKIAITPDGTKAYVTNFLNSSVSVINTTTNSVIGLSIPVGFLPQGIAITPNGARAYVANVGNDTVSVIDIATNSVVGAPIIVGDAPSEIAITPDGSRAYVTNAGGGTVSVIDTATNMVVGLPIPVGDGPQGIAIMPNGARAYVANANSDTISVIDIATNSILTTISTLDNPQGVAITPDGNFALVTNAGTDTVSMFDTTTNLQVFPLAVIVGDNPLGIAITPDGSRAYVSNLLDNNVSVIDVATNSVIGTPIPVGFFPQGIAITPITI
ncbi:NTTRR-F1 domain [Paenibacillus ginsengarvi]|uniref:YncE family protein n=1 Tax=Paenibacillus ginsengarvi TaxID=400777 RepID=A0A3B0C1R1_9BACL|nr:NTTRR-F1 domain [Paenibacillus ginsengarvi]RKN78199.1 YncE family protein [Paenibacillus ginsengarvi]